MTNVQLEKLVLELQSRVEFLESQSPEFKVKRQLELQRKANEEKEAQEKLEREKAEAERQFRRSLFNDNFQRLEQPSLICKVCSQPLVSESLVRHWINGRTDLCLRKPRLALKQGLLKQDQFDMIPDDRIEIGYVFEGIGTGEGDIQSERDYNPSLNPLAGESEVKTIRHLSGGA